MEAGADSDSGSDGCDGSGRELQAVPAEPTSTAVQAAAQGLAQSARSIWDDVLVSFRHVPAGLITQTREPNGRNTTEISKTPYQATARTQHTTACTQ